MSNQFPINNDMHCHSGLSHCSADPEMTPEAIGRHAAACGYDVQCITDHLWDSDVPGANFWYAPQDVAYVEQNLPLPEIPGVRMVFGCEVEMGIGFNLALTKEHMDDFEWIVISPNHFHWKGLTRPEEVDTEEKMAVYFADRLLGLSEMDLPWHKIGIGHLTCILAYDEGDFYKVVRLMDEEKLIKAFTNFAKNGAGIELNWGAISRLDRKNHVEEMMRLYRIAKQCGCKFYCASDAHHLNALDIQEGLREFVDVLGLTAEDRYILA